MKPFLTFALLCLVLMNGGAQTNDALVRLALIAEKDEAATVSDLLTARLSANPRLALLERNEIKKVYREQGLSAANKDYLKLGRIIGADGLLLLDIVSTKWATNLSARLIAVKPGVVLSDGSVPWPLPDVMEWANSAVAYLQPLMPKSTVLAKDAIPLSLVNFRYAVPSAEAPQMEQQLKLLMIQRLSRQREVFVLERQRMRSLSEEKAFNADEAAFWSGSYLLEGIVDQAGYSQETMTVSARLKPPNDGAPMLLEARGSRTNLAEVVQQLTAKVNEFLNIHSPVTNWNIAEEAAQFSQEAQWALRWGAVLEARAAADAAWALGKRDLNCATLRVKSYSQGLAWPNNQFLNGSSSAEATMKWDLERQLRSKGHLGIVIKRMRITQGDNRKIDVADYTYLQNKPDVADIAPARRALEMYYDFSRTLSGADLKPDSSWCRLGVEVLDVASQILLRFHFVPESQAPVAEDLAELRRAARSVASWISELPWVHASYFVGDRIATGEDLKKAIFNYPNIFSSKVTWGCFWQERPEDAVALYRKLMESPVFSLIHQGLWLRDLRAPRLAAWNMADRKRLPEIWNSFVQQLSASSNVLWRLEAKALEFSDALKEEEKEAAFAALFDGLLANREALMANKVEVLYRNWSTEGLLLHQQSHGPVSAVSSRLQCRLDSEYSPQLRAMAVERGKKLTQLGKTQESFEAQKRYLEANESFDFIKYSKLFYYKDYSQAQARELMPLLAGYKSNLVARANLSSADKVALRMGVRKIEALEKEVSHALNPPPQPVQPEAAPSQKPAPGRIAPIQPAAAKTQMPMESVTNVLLIRNYFQFPQERLMTGQPRETIGSLEIWAPRIHEGKLWSDVRYIHGYDVYSSNQTRRVGVAHAAAACLNPETGSWGIIPYPDPTPREIPPKAEFSQIYAGSLYVSGEDYLRRYDFKTLKWETLSVPWLRAPQLFAVGQRLFAAHNEAIFELAEDGRRIKILASCRRRPTVSALDTFDHLGEPRLFAGPNQALCASIGKKVFVWDEQNWRELFSLDFSGPPQVFRDGIVFRGFYPERVARLWLWRGESAEPQLALREILPSRSPVWNPMYFEASEQPMWKPLDNCTLYFHSMTLGGSNLCFFLEHAVMTNVSSRWMVMEKDGHHAKLVCLSQKWPEPFVLPLKFDLQSGPPPFNSFGNKWHAGAWRSDLTWLLFGGTNFYLGHPNLPGVWSIPIALLETAVAEGKQNQMDKQRRVTRDKDQLRMDLQAKYDLNHDGALETEEKIKAWKDLTFIESDLDSIDVNHNGRMDPEELGYFDANNNRILDTDEQAGIGAAQYILASQVMKRYDVNGNGSLDVSELHGLAQAGFGAHNPPSRLLLAPGGNRMDRVELRQIEWFLDQQTKWCLNSRRISDTPPLGPRQTEKFNSVNRKDAFKILVDLYWQHPEYFTNKTPPAQVIVNRQGESAVTNQIEWNYVR